jgi:hypothetical protein
VTRHGDKSLVDGGILIQLPELKTAREWCEFYGVSVDESGVVVLYKAVRDDYKTHQYGFMYQPGTMPEAPDWDGGERECGGGLHFSPHPIMALKYDRDATKFIACPVKADDIVTHPNGQFPDKVKAPRLCAPCYEVDIDGNRV